MKPSHERHLRVLSSIDEDILDANTERRADLYLARKTRRTLSHRRPLIATTAAVLAASILLVIFLPMLIKQRPVYRGMSISGADVPTLAAFMEEGDMQKHTLYAEPHFGKGNEGNGAENKKPSDLHPIGGTYFATPGEDVLLYVHLDNPDNFEILSFTLNGKKYSSYMFEEGSTLELLILKVNVGDAEGVRDFTIDAIKYVDGEKIKDVRMKGDRVIKVAVAYDSSVQAEIMARDVTYDSLTVSTHMNDALGLTKNSELTATLYNGSTAMATKVLDAARTAHFSGLAPCHSYRVVLTAHYDDLLGGGVKEHTLAEGFVSTKSFLDIQTVKDTSLYATLSVNDTDFTLVRVETVRNGQVTEVDATHVPLSIGNNVLRITYLHEGAEHTSELVHPLSVAESGLYSVGKGYSADEPVWNPSTSDFREHPALDLYATGSTEVYAFSDGVVLDVYLDSRYGRTVAVSSVIDGVTYRVLYQCLSVDQITEVKVGDRLTAGDLIGHVGTGLLEGVENDHLHLCVETANGESTVDPFPLFFHS